MMDRDRYRRTASTRPARVQQGRSVAQGESAEASARVDARRNLARDSPFETVEVDRERSGIEEAAVNHRRSVTGSAIHILS